eukprot:s421_g7.t1
MRSKQQRSGSDSLVGFGELAMPTTAETLMLRVHTAASPLLETAKSLAAEAVAATKPANADALPDNNSGDAKDGPVPEGNKDVASSSAVPTPADASDGTVPVENNKENAEKNTEEKVGQPKGNAVGTFLLNAQRFDGYDETKAGQLTLLEATIVRASLPVEDCSALLQLLQQQPCWTEAERQRLATAIQRSAAQRQATLGNRLSMQDFTSLPLYFTKELWSQIVDPALTVPPKLAAVAEFAGSLGLRNPS